LKPWNINLSDILTSFLNEIREKGYLDFSASGTALLSSSIIHRMKSELILKMEEPPKPKEKPPEDFVPPPLPFPFRFEYTLTSVSEILDALVSTLEHERVIIEKQQHSVLDELQVPTHQIDDFLLDIDKHMDKLYLDLIRKFEFEKEPISFIKLTTQLPQIDTIRTFILVLFLGHKNRILLIQRENDLLIEPLPDGVDNAG
jgi:segregation and condensation protein A